MHKKLHALPCMTDIINTKDKWFYLYIFFGMRCSISNLNKIYVYLYFV